MTSSTAAGPPEQASVCVKSDQASGISTTFSGKRLTAPPNSTTRIPGPLWYYHEYFHFAEVIRLNRESRASIRNFLTDFRFDNPDEYVHCTPFPELARLRRESPFSWHASSRDHRDGFWLATRHADIISISKNPKLFATNAPLLGDPIPRELWSVFPAMAMIADNLMTFDPQKHLLFRTIINPLFSADRVAELEREVRATCVEVIESVSCRSRFDFATDVALPIPVEVVMGKVLGVPREDLAAVSCCMLTINAMEDPFFRPRLESLPEAAEQLFAYGVALLGRLKASPSHNQLSDLVHNTIAQGLSIEELTAAYWFPLAAGAFDTTASTIAGGVLALLQFPDQMKILREDPGAIPSAVEEMVRWVSPVVYFRRTATADTEFRGNRIGRGEKILLCYPSANRDEDVFSNPDSFDVKRAPNPHIAFGYGPHFCLGAQLSSLVLRIFLKEFLQRMPGMELDGDVIHTRSGWMNRIRTMPVRNTRALAEHRPDASVEFP
jgi:cholest-4-en-3-one 26-monooxygenase